MSGPDVIRQDFGGIDDLHARVVGLQRGMNDTLDRIRSQVEPLVQTWDGQARSEYHVTQQKWDRASADLNLLLDRIAVAVARGNDEMRSVESELARRWQA
ncbi:WXG100 family type VII secretion target [Rhodococcus rhodochrous]|uniref:WXG100 family type VII secretion target n=1 Tax=Rhodococcus rhodochrous TaxID=1829 RepID=UPI000A89CF10|nr:WXG100 family type VII secretion target [Rhodococcus rhodochrous]